jgi:hypothetical protein
MHIHANTSYILIALFVRLSVQVPKWIAPGIKANVVSVCLFVIDIRELRPGQWDERALRTSIRPFVFLSFLVSVRPSVHPSVSLSVYSSFFLSLTSPSSLAPFSVSLIYIFLVFFSSNHVIGLLSMRSNVHTTAYMQLLDFFNCQFCTWNIWFQISTYLKDFSWKINGPKLARLCGKKKFIKHRLLW